jgi:hypothetical protein
MKLSFGSRKKDSGSPTSAIHVAFEFGTVQEEKRAGVRDLG